MINARVELRDADDELLATIRIDEEGVLETDGIEADLLEDIAVYDGSSDDDMAPVSRTAQPERWLYCLQYAFRNPYRHAVYIPE